MEEITEKKRLIDWSHVYLLGWYGRNGRPYLTTWKGNYPYIIVVVTGPHVGTWGPPMWKFNRNVKKSAGFGHSISAFMLHEVPTGTSPDTYAKEINGVKAIGWYIEEGFQREDA